MRTSLKPYPEYRDCSLPWLGQIPTHWQVRRNGYLFVQRNETGYGELPILEVSFNTGVRVRDFAGSSRKQVMSDREKYKRAAQGDIAYNMMRLWQGAVGVAPTDGLVSPAYVVAKPYPGTLSDYFVELFRTDACKAEINNYSRGIVSDRNRLYWDEFKQMPVCVPPTEEQAAIVRYLNHTEQKFRQFVQAKRRLIELLNEQRRAIVDEFVTRGLPGTASLATSSLAWLTELPDHWRLIRLRSVVDRIEQGVSPLAEACRADDGSWGVLKAGCVNHGIFRESEHKRLPEGFQIDPGLVLQVGDILVSRACGSPKLVGSVGRVEALRYRLILSDKTFRLVLRDQRLSDFLVYAMNSRYYRKQVEQEISGAEGLANNLPLSSLKNIWLAIPPVQEAQEIVKALRQETRKVESAITATRQEVELITEYRTRLIADVVTGRLDVREASERLPSQAEQAALDDESLGLSALDPEETDGLEDDPELLPVTDDEE